MSAFVRDIRHRGEFAAAWCLLQIVRSLPLCAVRPLAWSISCVVRLVPGAEKTGGRNRPFPQDNSPLL